MSEETAIGVNSTLPVEITDSLSHTELKELKQKTNNLLGWQNVYATSYWAIGKELYEIKHNDLTHGHWMAFLNVVGIENSWAHKAMKVWQTLFMDADDGDREALSDASQRKLNVLAYFPNSSEQLHRVFTNSNGESKELLDMSANEIKELKAQLAEEKVKSHEANGLVDSLNTKVEDFEEQMADMTVENFNLKKEKRIVKTEYKDRIVEKEVAPKDYYKIKEELQQKEIQGEQLNSEITRLKSIVEGSESTTKQVQDAKQQLLEINKEIRNLNENLIGLKNLQKVIQKGNDYLKNVAPYLGSIYVENLDPDTPAAKEFHDFAYQVFNIGQQLVAHIPGNIPGKATRHVKFLKGNIIEGQSINS